MTGIYIGAASVAASVASAAGASVASAAAANVTGKIVRSSVGINRFGKLDTKVTVETGKEQITTEKVVAHSYEETTEQKTYQGAQVADPVAEVGFIKTVRNEASKYPRKWNVLTRIRKILRLDTAVQYDSADDADGHSVVEESLGQPNTPGGLAVVLTAGAGESLQASVQYDKESDTLDVRINPEAEEGIAVFREMLPEFRRVLRKHVEFTEGKIK